MIPNFGMVYLSAWNLTACRVAFAARHQVLVWSRFFCDGFKTVFSMSSSLLFLIFFIAVIIWYSKLSIRNKSKTNLISRYKHIRSDLFQYLFNYLSIYLSIYTSTLSMLHYIFNATVKNLGRIISSTLYHIINATLHYQNCITLPMINYNILSTQHYFLNTVLHHQPFFAPATLLYIVIASLHYKCCIQKWNKDLTELHHVMQSCIREFCPTTNSISKKSFLQMFHEVFAPKTFKDSRK